LNFSAFLRHVPGYFAFAKRFKKGITVLGYHGIEKEITNPFIQGAVQMSLKDFERQIHYLRRNYEIISIKDFYACLHESRALDPSQVLITFDDGYKNHLEVVAPFLKVYDIPFTLFINTKNVDQGVRFETYYLRAAVYHTKHPCLDLSSIQEKFDTSSEKKKASTYWKLSHIIKTAPQPRVRNLVEEIIHLFPPEEWSEINDRFYSEEPLNWKDVEELRHAGATIGSHGHDHALLHADQGEEEVRYQVRHSKELIEEHCGTCSYFAYPGGSIREVAPASARIVRENGYSLGFTTVLGEVEDAFGRYLLPRICPPGEFDTFKLWLNTSFQHNAHYRKWRSEVNL